MRETLDVGEWDIIICTVLPQRIPNELIDIGGLQ